MTPAPCRRVVVTDIFGRTTALEALAARVPGVTEIVDPYGGHDPGYTSEEDAYADFSQRVGVDAYAAMLARRIQSLNANVSLLAFSVGGAAAWQLTQPSPPSRVRGALCFYASQVRHRVAAPPPFPVHLVVPASEPHFDVNAFAHAVRQHPRVRVTQSRCQHGYLNALSPGFDAAACDAVVEALCDLPESECLSRVEL